jgi:hypothetical protein
MTTPTPKPSETLSELVDAKTMARRRTERRRAEAQKAERLQTRAQRLAHPTSVAALRKLATEHDVCIRPQAMRMLDRATGKTEWMDLRCGATRESKCPSCARRAKLLREVQARLGWHAEDEPAPEPEASTEQVELLKLRAMYEYLRADCLNKAEWHHIADLDVGIEDVEAQIRATGMRGRVTPPADHTAAIAAQHANLSQTHASVLDTADAADPSTVDVHGLEPGPAAGNGGASGSPSNVSSAAGKTPGNGRRVRSTRRRQDAPNLPRRTVENRTIGRTFQGRDAAVFRPSTFVTLTLPSYGRVREDGSPVDPGSYDYRRAAWDAVHFPALIDRLFHNLRRAVGWNVQYFGTVEPQRRLAPHAHFAIRGAIPRAVLRQVIAATYEQVWWPSTATVVYSEGSAAPEWDEETGVYRDPATGRALSTWDEALNDLDEQLDADSARGPEHVVRFGEQVNLQGVLAGTPQADKLIKYLSKYLTKSVDQCHQATTATAAEHQRRLHDELRFTPCSPRCPNWLRYGIQPKDAKDGMKAGQCRGKVHQPDTLGLGGRRVLVSRLWSGKTLADHRYDQKLWWRNHLAIADRVDDDIDPDMQNRIDAARAGGAPAPIAWERCKPGDPDVPDLPRRLLRSITASIKHREFIAAARARGHPPGADSVTATAGGHA